MSTSRHERQQREAAGQGDQAQRKPKRRVGLGAAGADYPHEQVRPEPTEAGEQARYRDEMRAPDDDRDGQQEDDEGSQ